MATDYLSDCVRCRPELAKAWSGTNSFGGTTPPDLAELMATAVFAKSGRRKSGSYARFRDCAASMMSHSMHRQLSARPYQLDRISPAGLLP
jgi:hypothetical protein